MGSCMNAPATALSPVSVVSMDSVVSAWRRKPFEAFCWPCRAAMAKVWGWGKRGRVVVCDGR
jgi:hypothetical protein